MSKTMVGLKRTHMCEEVNETHVGQIVTIMGWVNKKRDFPGHVFIILRDRTGIIQVAVNNEEMLKKIKNVRTEYILAIQGRVVLRTENNINPDMKTGKIEIEATELRILSEAAVPPFQVADVGVKEDLRLKHRYVDLKRPEIQNNLIVRHKIYQSVRNFLNNQGCIEVETPILGRSTPEGARDYLVPSRVYPGNFYALPQSPQQYKQLLMLSGFDKYYQIAKCFRDEDLRADRQPEFTQIDIELSFVDQEDVINLAEGMVRDMFKDVLDYEVSLPIKRMTYDEAMERFGSDKPDLRFGMELKNISDLVKDTDFGVFKSAIDAGGSVRGINVLGLADMPRKQIDSLIEFVKTYKAKGLAWISVLEDGEFKTTLSKFFTNDELSKIAEVFSAKAGDLILLCADSDDVVFDSLGALRCEVARRENLIDPNKYEFLWVVDFPLLEWDEETNRFYAKHHPFTMVKDEDIELLETNPKKARAKAYDIVINGYEAGGGSMRIYQKEVQEKMFNILGFTKEEAEERFGYFLEAFKYGAPPHGGIAFGLDRLNMLAVKTTAIRDVIAFPKVKDASCPLTDAPNIVEDAQLEELGLDITEKTEMEQNEKI